MEPPEGTPPPGKFAATVTLGEKGQIVIPKGARDLFGIKPGDMVLLLADSERGIAIMPPDLSAQVITHTLDTVGKPRTEES
ncbi:AbrB/MazE/SpoVT family DNA-binding domain-containing protein [Actinomyces slackii]|uniref:Transcriptional regulator, AbrB family n=1 Tax=Actinomyces slackii TaxID=52774 RepID=A0A3S4UQ71_9ACTO|nr:AbrB/MazE/SpoVT family DNA-binding domain-containing protein [Actinomyces slackii]VEG75732.1 transcriptional regulator, AbrB family [Actinomyces slackii]